MLLVNEFESFNNKSTEKQKELYAIYFVQC